MDKDLSNKVHEVVGAIKMAKTIANFVDSARYGLYKHLRDSKAYKALGMDWKEFCEEKLQRSQNTVNQEIKLLEEFGESFLKAAERMGLSKRELNALGSGLSEEAKADFKKGVITIGDVKIKETEITEHLDDLKEAITAFTKQTEETRAELKAQQRLVEDFRKNNEKLHKQLDKYVKKEEDKELATEEAEFIDKMGKLRTSFDGYMLKVQPDGMDDLGEDNATDRMRAAYLTSLDYMRQQILAAYEGAKIRFGSSITIPEEGWSPGKGAALGKKAKE